MSTEEITLKLKTLNNAELDNPGYIAMKLDNYKAKHPQNQMSGLLVCDT